MECIYIISPGVKFRIFNISTNKTDSLIRELHGHAAANVAVLIHETAAQTNHPQLLFAVHF